MLFRKEISCIQLETILFIVSRDKLFKTGYLRKFY